MPSRAHSVKVSGRVINIGTRALADMQNLVAMWGEPDQNDEPHIFQIFTSAIPHNYAGYPLSDKKILL